MTLFSSEKFFLERKKKWILGFGPVAEGWRSPLLAQRARAKSCAEMHAARGGDGGAQPNGEPGAHPRAGAGWAWGGWPLPGADSVQGPSACAHAGSDMGQLPRRVDGRDLQSSLPGLMPTPKKRPGACAGKHVVRRKGPPAAAWTLRSPLLRQACKSCELPLEPGCAWPACTLSLSLWFDKPFPIPGGSEETAFCFQQS